MKKTIISLALLSLFSCSQENNEVSIEKKLPMNKVLDKKKSYPIVDIANKHSFYSNYNHGIIEGTSFFYMEVSNSLVAVDLNKAYSKKGYDSSGKYYYVDIKCPKPYAECGVNVTYDTDKRTSINSVSDTSMHQIQFNIASHQQAFTAEFNKIKQFPIKNNNAAFLKDIYNKRQSKKYIVYADDELTNNQLSLRTIEKQNAKGSYTAICTDSTFGIIEDKNVGNSNGNICVYGGRVYNVKCKSKSKWSIQSAADYICSN